MVIVADFVPLVATSAIGKPTFDGYEIVRNIALGDHDDARIYNFGEQDKACKYRENQHNQNDEEDISISFRQGLFTSTINSSKHPYKDGCIEHVL